MKVALVACTLLLVTGSARADSDAINEWLGALPLDPGVTAELHRFSADEGDWPAGTEERLARIFRDRILADVGRAVDRIATGDHEEWVRVNYLEPADFAHDGAETTDKQGRKFEEGIIRTEQVAFFPGISTPADEALRQFVDPEFRKQTSSRIEEIHEEDGVSCIRTKGLWGLLEPTSSCNRIVLLNSAALAAEHSQVISNPGGKDFQPVYFKESVKVFFATDAGLLLYYINYTRSAKLGSFKKKLGRGKIEDSQRDRAAALAAILGPHGN